MNPGPSSASVGRAAEKKSAASTTSAGGSDSGYDSISNATSAATTHHSQDSADGVVPSRRIFGRKVNLRVFGTEIPQITQHRFHDLLELFDRPLCEYLIKANINPESIAIKLRVLGESVATAKPWIVVLCNKAASRKIRQFFNQQQIKAVYQPSEPDSFQPSFEVFVCSRPPRLMAGMEIYGDLGEGSTICGRIIKVGEAHQSRFATLGGVIKVINSSGVVKLYGMTAGHILTQQSLGQPSFDQVNVPDEEDDEGFYSGEEEYELENSVFERDEAQDKTRPVSQSTHLGSSWPRIGSVSVNSNEAANMDGDHDWALIILDTATDHRPNLLVPCDGDEKAARSRPLKENRKSTEDGSGRTVCLLSGTGGIKNGTLSTSLSFLMMGPAKAFTKTYTLTLSHGSVLNAGDCGSWVVDPSTCEVYGHVIASDAMGDTYVVPLSATLRDMEKRLGAAVSLPTETDINTWVAQHAQAVMEPSRRTSAAGKTKRVSFNDPKTDRVEHARSVQKLAQRPSPQSSMSIASTATKTPASVVDRCISCNAQFKGTPENIKSDLQRHLRTCSKQGKDVTPEVKTSSPRDNRVALDESSKKVQVRNSKDVQQGAKANVSTQLKNPIPWSLRSMYSGMTKKPSHNPLQEDENEGKSTSTSKGKEHTGSTSSTKPTVTALPTSTFKDSQSSAKVSRSKKDSDISPSSKTMPAVSSELAGRASRDSPRTPIPTPMPMSTRRQSFSTATPMTPRLHHEAKTSAPLPPHRPPPPQRVHSHGNIPKRSPNLYHQSNTNHPGQVTYEGYTFTKCDSRQTGRKETWAIAHMVPMPVSQKDLQDQIKRNKKKRTTALDEYNDENMNGFKRKQVDNLIRERAKLDGDFGYEYELASIKLDSRKTRTKSIETLSMQVILKRQLIAGFRHVDPAVPAIDIHARLPGKVMDLTSGEELGNLRDLRPVSQHVGPGPGIVPFAPYPGYGAIPVSAVHGPVFDHGIQHDENRRTPFYAAPYSFTPTLPPMQGINVPSPMQDRRQHQYPQSVPILHQESHNNQAHQKGVLHKDDERKKAPDTDDARHGSRKQHDYPSNAFSYSDSSFGIQSSSSWTKTDATPDTEFTDRSRERRQEKSSRKESSDKSFAKDRIEEPASPHNKEEMSYREHKRKDPVHASRSLIPRPRDLFADSIDLDLAHHSSRRAPTLRHPRDIQLARSHHRRSSFSSYDPYPRPQPPPSSRDLALPPGVAYRDFNTNAPDPLRQQRSEREENLRLMREVDERVRRRTEAESSLDREMASELHERESWPRSTAYSYDDYPRSRHSGVEAERLDREIARREKELDERERWRDRTAYDRHSQSRDPGYYY